MIHELAPADVVERLWVKDIVDLQWDIDRARRAKAVAISLAEQDALVKALDASATGDTRVRDMSGGSRAQAADYLMLRSRSRDPNDAVTSELFPFSEQPIRQALSMSGLTVAQSGEAAFLEALRNIERLDHLIHTYSRRRDSIIRDLERRRADRAVRVSPSRDRGRQA